MQSHDEGNELLARLRQVARRRVTYAGPMEIKIDEMVEIIDQLPAYEGLPADTEVRIEKVLAQHIGVGCPDPGCDPTRPHGEFFQHLAHEVTVALHG